MSDSERHEGCSWQGPEDDYSSCADMTSSCSSGENTPVEEMSTVVEPDVSSSSLGSSTPQQESTSSGTQVELRATDFRMVSRSAGLDLNTAHEYPAGAPPLVPPVSTVMDVTYVSDHAEFVGSYVSSGVYENDVRRISMMHWCIDSLETFATGFSMANTGEILSNIQLILLGQWQPLVDDVLNLDTAFHEAFLNIYFRFMQNCEMHDSPEATDFMRKVSMHLVRDPRYDMVHLCIMLAKIAELMVEQRESRQLPDLVCMAFHHMAARSLIRMTAVALMADHRQMWEGLILRLSEHLHLAMGIAQSYPSTEKPPHYFRLRLSLTAAYVSAYLTGRFGKACSMYGSIREQCKRRIDKHPDEKETLSVIVDEIDEQVKRVKNYLLRQKVWRMVWKPEDMYRAWEFHRSIDFRRWVFFQKSSDPIQTPLPGQSGAVLQVEGHSAVFSSRPLPGLPILSRNPTVTSPVFRPGTVQGIYPGRVMRGLKSHPLTTPKRL